MKLRILATIISLYFLRIFTRFQAFCGAEEHLNKPPFEFISYTINFRSFNSLTTFYCINAEGTATSDGHDCEAVFIKWDISC